MPKSFPDATKDHTNQACECWVSTA